MSDDALAAIKRRWRQARKDAGFSAAQAAEICGRNAKTYYAWENPNDPTSPRLSDVAQCMARLRISPSFVLLGVGCPRLGGEIAEPLHEIIFRFLLTLPESDLFVLARVVGLGEEVQHLEADYLRREKRGR